MTPLCGLRDGEGARGIETPFQDRPVDDQGAGKLTLGGRLFGSSRVDEERLSCTLPRESSDCTLAQTAWPADVDGTKFWESTLADGEPTPSKPKLLWPGDDNDLTVKSMRGGTRRLAKGLADFATGVNLTIRNVATHAGGELSEQEGLERLAAYSYPARLLDQCEIPTTPRGFARRRTQRTLTSTLTGRSPVGEAR